MITELKPLHILYSSIEYEDGTHDSGSDYDVYDKDAVDAVLKEKDAEIARLKQERTDITSVSAITCNATLITIHKLLRALWTVRMKFMWSECHLKGTTAVKNKQMRYRIVKKETLSLDGVLHIAYYPEYKGWFGWNRFVKYNLDNGHTCAGFDDYCKAKAFLNSVARLKGLQQVSVVSEFVYGNGLTDPKEFETCAEAQAVPKGTPI